jgi:SAM-dependent methyltransferase
MMSTHDLMTRYYPRPQADPLDDLFCHYARPGMSVLDAGCGGERGLAHESCRDEMVVFGTDRDPSVGRNPFCNHTCVSDLSRIPFKSGSFDLVHSRWVLEHLPDPVAAFREFSRVLKPGGRLLAITPNVFHYATTAARITPHWFHRWFWRGKYDPFPTYFRANSREAIHRLCRGTGLELDKLELIEGPPRYLKSHRLAFRLGVAYQRIVSSTPLLAPFRHVMIFSAVANGAVSTRGSTCHS